MFMSSTSSCTRTSRRFETLIANPMAEAKIKVQPMELANLLNLMAYGQLQVPRFQREFVWPVSKTRKLLDSMFKEYPIGTFFFWQAPLEYADLFRDLPDINIPKPDKGAPTSFILDGQQRLTSLFVTINGMTISGKDYSRICIDLDQAARHEAGEIDDQDDNDDDDQSDARIFVHRQPDNRRWIAVKDLLQHDNFEIYDQIPKEWRPVFTKATTRLRGYPLSVVWVKDQGLDEVVDIFQRINQGGKRLSRYDLVCANLWEKQFDFRSEVTRFNKSLESQGFGALDGTIVTQAFSLINYDSCTTPVELKMKTSDVQKSWEDVISAIRLAIDFVKANFGVDRYEFLPYRGTLPVLAYFFFHAPKTTINAQQRQALWDWFWRVTLSERYSTTTPSRMAEDARKLIRVHKGEQVSFDYVSMATPEAVAATSMTATSSALRNAILCLLTMQHPRNFKDGSPINLANDFFSDLKKPERHHIFPNAFLTKQGVTSRKVHLVANFCFIPADLNKEISAKEPTQYLAEYQTSNPNFAEDIATHLIEVNSDSPVWKNDFDSFIQRRSEALSKALNAMISDGPSKPLVLPDGSGRGKDAEIVTEIEIRLRDLIDSRLTAVQGERYWKGSIPGDVQGYAKDRISQHLAGHPYESWDDYSTGRDRLDYVNVGDYKKIISVNFVIFQPVFGKKETFNQHMSAFEDFRNCVAHNKQINKVQRSLADAAVTWIHQSLDSYDRRLREEAIALENGGQE